MKVELGGYKYFDKKFITINLTYADIIWNLNKLPYPLKENSVDELRIFHCLEHLREPKKVMEEIYRVCKHNAEVFIKIPHYSNQSVLKNPEHLWDFHPDWFKSLCSNEKKGCSVYKNMEHLKKCDFKILNIKNTSVWWNPFIKIETIIKMQVNKL